MTEQDGVVPHRATEGPATAGEPIPSSPGRRSVHGTGQGVRIRKIQRKVVRMGFGKASVCDVYGAGGHAQVVIDVLRAQGVHVRGQYNDRPEVQHPASFNVMPGVRRLGRDRFPAPAHPVVLAVGLNGQRAELARMLDASFAQAVHPTAIIASTATIGEGSVVLHGSVVQANARIGRFVLVNTAASVDHDCVIGDYAHISPHATLSGHVEVGEGTHIGAGAVVIPKVKIGRWCRVGAGTVVLEDLPDHCTAVGNPARIVPGRTGEPVPDWSLVREDRRDSTGVVVP